MDKPSALTPKAAQTRELILNTALDLFAQKGYAETTMRNIAAGAGVSLGLTYRYFERKEDLVLELYRRLSDGCVEEVGTLPPGTLGQRFERAMIICFDRLQDHRGTLESLFAVGISSSSEVAVLGDRSAAVRIKMIGMYEGVISGSSERLKPTQVEQLKTLLYAVHMLMVLVWIQDRSEKQHRTRDLIGVVSRLMRYVKPIMALRPISNAIEESSRIIGPMFGAPEPLG